MGCWNTLHLQSQAVIKALNRSQFILYYSDNWFFAFQHGPNHEFSNHSYWFYFYIYLHLDFMNFIAWLVISTA